MDNPRQILERLAALDPRKATKAEITALVQAAREAIAPKGAEHLHQARELAAQVRSRKAAGFYETILEKVRVIDPNRQLSYAELAAALNQDGVKTSTGKDWSGGTIHSVLTRSERPTPS